MATDYRAMRLPEDRETMDLWVKVFNVPEAFFRTLIDVDEIRSLDQTRVACDGQKIVSALHVFYRTTRGLDGRFLKMGGIANVATYEEARKLGHSGRLLQDVLEQMEKDGCEWSMLFTGVNQHYARYGWKTIPTRTRKGKLRPAGVAQVGSYDVAPVSDVSNVLSELLPVHDAFDEHRPLSMVRDLRTWQIATYFRMGPESGATVYTAKAGEQVVAYAIVKGNESEVQVIECACLPKHGEALSSVFDAVGEVARRAGVDAVVANLPSEPLIDQAIDRVATDVKWQEHGHVMARPIGERMTMDEVEALFAAPGAIYWELDNF